MKSDFPISYAVSDSIAVLATIIALNFATATFLVGTLLNIEEKVNQDVFAGPREEIKQNVNVMAALLLFNILLVALIAQSRHVELWHTGIQLNYVLATFVLAVLFYYVILLLEIISAAIALRVPRKKK
jgi:hypothetical protein